MNITPLQPKVSRTAVKIDTNFNKNTIEIPQRSSYKNDIIHRRPNQFKHIKINTRRAISTAHTFQDNQKSRFSHNKSFQKFRTQHTSRSHRYKESQSKQSEVEDKFQRLVTSYNNFRLRRTTIGTSQEHRWDQNSERETSVFNEKDRQIKAHRLKSQPLKPFTLKQQIIRRINNKISLVKKLTPQMQQQSQSPMIKISKMIPPSQSASLFKFDQLYDHCLKKLKKCINIYEKDLNKSKDKQYFELKIQTSMLSKQFKQMRNSLVKKKDNAQYFAESSMGIIGKNISVREIQKNHVARGLSANFKKKIGRIQKMIEKKNPFVEGQMQGWDIRLERGEEFQI